MPQPSGSITAMLHQLSSGDMSVVDGLWHRFWKRLSAKAKESIGGNRLQSADEEDIAQTVFLDVIQRIAKQKIAHVENRRRLWRLMEVSTFHVAVDLHRSDRAGRRAEDARLELMGSQSPQEPAQGFFVALDDDLDKLSEMLDERAKMIVIMILHGYGSTEIAGRLQTTPRTIQRKLVAIRDAWMKINTNQNM